MRRAAWTALLAAVIATAVPASAHHVTDLDEMPIACRGGHPISTSPSADCIPSIDDPAFDDGSWLDDADRVIGVAAAGEARAYAVRILNWHEIVNDEIDGVPLAVTYCPLCGTGMVFDRSVGLATLEFGVSGRLFHNDLVMYDRQTESLWPQVMGQAVWGPMHGSSLEILGSSTTTWGAWRAEHPGTVALARPPDRAQSLYDRFPYGDYEENRDTLFPRSHRDDRLHPKAWVFGVERGGHAIAFVVDELAAGAPLVAAVDDRDVLLGLHAGAPVAWWATPGSLSVDAGRVVDRDGHEWNASTGTGPKGAALERAPGIAAFWFAWADFHPETALWPGDAVAAGAPPGDPGRRGSSAPGVVAALLGLAAVAFMAHRRRA